jgi:hypothetical protein
LLRARAAEQEALRDREAARAKLRKAMDIAQGDEEEASLSLIGQALRRLDPGFDPRSYGHPSLSGLVAALKDKLEVRREEKGNTLLVRWKA